MGTNRDNDAEKLSKFLDTLSTPFKDFEPGGRFKFPLQDPVWITGKDGETKIEDLSFKSPNVASRAQLGDVSSLVTNHDEPVDSKFRLKVVVDYSVCQEYAQKMALDTSAIVVREHWSFRDQKAFYQGLAMLFPHLGRTVLPEPAKSPPSTS